MPLAGAAEAGPDPGVAPSTPPQTYTGGRLFTPYAFEVTLVEPVHLPGDGASPTSPGLLAAIALFALGLSVARVGGAGPPVHDPAAPPDRGVAAALAEGDLARRVPPSQVRAGSSELAELAVQFNAMADRARGERRDHPPRPRPQPRLPRRRVARAADAAGRPADVQRAAQGAAPATTPTRAPSSSSRAASRSSGSTGSPRTCSSSRSSIPASSCSTCDRTTSGRPSRPAVEQTRRGGPQARRRRCTLDLPDAPIRIRHDPQRIGQVVAQPRRQRGQVHAAAAASVTVDVAADRATAARIEVADTGRRHRPGRAAAHLRALLPRLAGERGARQRQRPRPGDRPIDRRHARRARSTVESRVGEGSTFIVDAAARSATGGRDARRPQRAAVASARPIGRP